MSIFFDSEAASETTNPFIASILASDASRGTDSPSKIGLRNFLYTVKMQDYWTYDGSFTQPPCTEGIKWSVMKEVQSISPEQLTTLKDGLKNTPNYDAERGNNRVVQNLNERTLFYSGATGIVTYAAATVAAVATLFF